MAAAARAGPVSGNLKQPADGAGWAARLVVRNDLASASRNGPAHPAGPSQTADIQAELDGRCRCQSYGASDSDWDSEASAPSWPIMIREAAAALALSNSASPAGRDWGRGFSQCIAKNFELTQNFDRRRDRYRGRRNVNLNSSARLSLAGRAPPESNGKPLAGFRGVQRGCLAAVVAVTVTVTVTGGDAAPVRVLLTPVSPVGGG